jgi:regulation of enolase protein 1 (concanavalin A-like superfamily)
LNVSTETQLQNAVSSAAPGATIVIAPGTYVLSSTLYLDANDLTLRGATNNRNDVVLVGRGMTNGNYGPVRFGIWTNQARITIANLTIRDVYEHHIIMNVGTEAPRIYNVRLVDAGSQFIKANPDNAGGGVDNGRLEHSVLEYTTTAPDYYTNGLDVHSGGGWLVRNNLFRNFRAPQGQLAGPAVLFWRGSRDPLVEGNTFINNQRDIVLGLEQATPNDNTGGIVRNNFIYRGSMAADSAIYIGDSPNTQVLHNTILVSGTYPQPIEYRFPNTTGVVIRNNLLDGSISARDGATGSVSHNYTAATASMFVNPAAGDLHLRSTATVVLDKVSALANALTDWDGQPRPQGAAADYGADERLIATTPPPNQAPAVTLTSPAAGAAFTAPATLALSATASDADGTVARVDFYAGTTIVASDTSSPYNASWGNVSAGSYTIRAVAIDDAGGSTTSASVGVTVSTPPTTTPPAPWVAADIGGPTLAGSAAHTSGTFTVTAGGVDIWGTADQFHFVYQPMTGDGEVIGRVGSLQNSNAWAKAGVMMRESLTAGSRHAMAVVTPANGTAFQRRTGPAADSLTTSGPAVTTPYWVRLVRQGSTFSAYTSAGGTSWTLIGSQSIAMTSNIYVGLAVTSHNASARTTATLTNVVVKASATVPPNQAPTVSLTSPTAGATFIAPATIALAATAADTDGTVARVDFYAGTSIVATDTTSPYSGSWGGVSTGSYTVRAVAVDNGGASTTSASVVVTVAAPPTTTLPTPWSTVNVGSPALAGSASHSSGTFTVAAAGVDIWGTSDQFRLVYQPLTGDGEVIARVASLQNTNTWAKAGVMMRETLGADSRHALAVVTPGNGVAFQRRSATGGESLTTPGPAVTAPYWVRLVRAGSTFAAYVSSNGSSWTLVGSDSIAMSSTILVGLAVTSHSASTLTTATFTNVSVAKAVAPAPPPSLPRQLVFTASADHSTTVNSYTIDIFTAGSNPATATPVSTRPIGKPTPMNGDVTVDIAAGVQALPSGTYFITVTAIGGGGSARSSPSPAFTR